ncbi:MAG: hypothetical protein ACREU7_07305 [Burkholderiales bacterium]
MEIKQKAARVLELLKLPLAGVNLRLCVDGGLHVFEADRNGVTHRVCYPDDVLAQRDPKELAMVAAAILTLLRSDPTPVDVVVRSGMFETMLRATSSYPNPLAATP